jgi:hypothetical protein
MGYVNPEHVRKRAFRYGIRRHSTCWNRQHIRAKHIHRYTHTHTHTHTQTQSVIMLHQAARAPAFAFAPDPASGFPGGVHPSFKGGTCLRWRCRCKMDFAFEGICAHPFKGGSCFNSRSRCKIFDIKGIRAPPPLRVVPVSFEEADAMMQYICNTSTHLQYIYTCAIHLHICNTSACDKAFAPFFKCTW